MGNALRLGIARIGLAINQWRLNRKSQKKTIVILILGLQGAGKSTIALRLWKLKKKLPEPTYVQTKGFNTYEITKKKLTIKIHDLGGHESVRELWTHYYADAHGIIYVVDSSKPDDLPVAGEILAEVLRDERMRRKPVLVLANKQDEPSAISEVDLTTRMDLVTTVNSVRCLTRIDICAATDLKMDQGIFNGFKWLVEHIETHYPEMNSRVSEDSAIDQEKEKARFNLRRSEVRRVREETELNTYNESARGKRRAERQNSTNNNPDEEEDGIDQVQKPRELQSRQGDPVVDVDVASNKNKPDPTLVARLSPEGAADSSDELKHFDLINADVNASSGANSNATTATTTTTTTTTFSVNSNEATNNLSANATTAINSIDNDLSREKISSSSSRDRVVVNNGTTTPATNPITTGYENHAFEHNEDDHESQQLPNNNDSSQSVNKKLPSSKLPTRNRAFSIRSNSTETDIELPGEIILVTTKAQVHESQEMLDDVNINPNYAYETVERNVSPTLSYISGHISHKTSQESVVSGALMSADSLHNSASKPNSRGRSSSFSHINEAELNSSNLVKSATQQQPTPLQKLVNIKSRNKTAPMTPDDVESGNHASNGNILATKKKQDNLTKA